MGWCPSQLTAHSSPHTAVTLRSAPSYIKLLSLRSSSLQNTPLPPPLPTQRSSSYLVLSTEHSSLLPPPPDRIFLSPHPFFIQNAPPLPYSIRSALLPLSSLLLPPPYCRSFLLPPRQNQPSDTFLCSTTPPSSLQDTPLLLTPHNYRHYSLLPPPYKNLTTPPSSLQDTPLLVPLEFLLYSSLLPPPYK